MSNWQVAVVREQGQTFAVVVVQDSVINTPSERNGVINLWTRELGCRVGLVGAQRHKTFGPGDIVRWLSGVSLDRLPWRRMTLAA